MNVLTEMNHLTYDFSSHPVFREFEPWHGRAHAGFDVNFLGQATDVSFAAGWNDEARSRERDAWPPYPQPSEETFEWINLLTGVLEAKGRFVMIEAGAGWGRWLVAAACAIRRRRVGLPMLLIGIEGDPTHFQWMQKHFCDNGLEPSDHRLIHGAVAAADGEQPFLLGDDPSAWWGQTLVSSTGQEPYSFDQNLVRMVRCYSIDTLLSDLPLVDVFDCDIQGEERNAIPAGILSMTRKVKRAFIETHSKEIDEELPRVLTAHGWRSEHCYPCQSEADTPFGRITFQGGPQCWVNTTLM